ncbi:MAG: hypothetical protein WBV71_14465, partial [Roseobacter sp.]
LQHLPHALLIRKPFVCFGLMLLKKSLRDCQQRILWKILLVKDHFANTVFQSLANENNVPEFRRIFRVADFLNSIRTKHLSSVGALRDTFSGWAKRLRAAVKQ